MTPTVLIASCINERKQYCIDEFMEYVLNLKYENKEYYFVDNSVNKNFRKKLIEKYGVDIDYVNPSEKTNAEYMCFSMNKIVRRLMNSNCDFLFNNECDIFCPDDTIMQLMSYRKLICSATYLQSEGYRSRLCEAQFENTFGLCTNRNIYDRESLHKLNGKLQVVGASGIGAILIHRLIFSNYRFRVDGRYPTTHCDTFFFQDLNEQNIDVYRDTGLMCMHKNSSWKTITDR